MKRFVALAVLLPFAGPVGCSLGGTTTSTQPAVQHILFVGDSFTHGRYLPVRTYNNTPGTGGLGSTAASTHVVDENFGTTIAARQETQSGETGPWGGIPGIFAEFASEAKLPSDVHIEAISATTLSENFGAASDVLERPGWDTIVLQEATFQPIPSSLSLNTKSDPGSFCNAVNAIEAGVHTTSPNTHIVLYETGAPADTAYSLSTTNQKFSDAAYLSSLGDLTAAYHDAYLSALTHNPHLDGLAPTGDAWALAWPQGIANPDPYAGTAPGVSLTFNYQSGSMPSTHNSPTDAGFHHPSMFGAYLNALVLFGRITGSDARLLGANEQAALSLGIPPAVAVELQAVAWEAVTQQNTSFSSRHYDPCAPAAMAGSSVELPAR